MKALKKTMIMVPVVLFCLLAAGLLWAGGARAAGDTGDFDVSGEVLNYSFDDNKKILTIEDGAVLTIANKPGISSTENRIVVAENAKADITLNGVKIAKATKDDEFCAFALETGAEVNLALAGESVNELTSGKNKAGLNVPEGATLTIGGTGRLKALCNGVDDSSRDATNGAGIGGSMGQDCGTVTINSGVVEAGCNALEGKGAGLGGGLNGAGGKVTIMGGSVNAHTEAGATGSQSEKIGHGAGSTNSGTLQNKVINPKGGFQNYDLHREPVVLTLKDGKGNPVKNTPITGLVAGMYTGVDKTEEFWAEEYGIHGMATDDEGKLYLYLEKDAVKNLETGDLAGVMTGEKDKQIYYEGAMLVDRSNSNIPAAITADLKPVSPDGAIDLSASGGNLYIWNDGYMCGSAPDPKNRHIYLGDYTLSSSGSDSTKNTVTFMSDYRGLENNQSIITAHKDVTLKGLKIDARGNAKENQCAFSLEAGAEVNLILEDTNTLTSGPDHAGLLVSLSATLLISENAGAPGSSLEAVCVGGTAEANGAGIGGSNAKNSGSIVIKSGTVTALSKSTGSCAANGAGIGGGAEGSSAGRITIEGGVVTARCESEDGDANGAGIGGGKNKPSSAEITFGGGTIEASCASASGHSYGAGIGGGLNGAGGDVNIYGGNVRAVGGKAPFNNIAPMDIGHGAGIDGKDSYKLPHRKAPWEESSMNVYLNILTVGDTADGSAVAAETPVWGTDEKDITKMTNDYVVKDVKTLPNPDGTQKPSMLYFYLTTSEETSDIIIQIKPSGSEAINYERQYARESGKVNKAVLLPRPQYSIVIPARLEFEDPTYKAADAPDRYNDVGFEVQILAPKYLSHGRSLNVTMTDKTLVDKEGGPEKGDPNFPLVGPGGDKLYYQIYKGRMKDGKIVPEGNPLKTTDVLVDKFDNTTTAPGYGVLRLDQNQIKYRGQYSNEGSMTFNINLVDKLEDPPAGN